MTDYEKLVDGLDSVTWYNGLAEYVYRWTKPGYLAHKYEMESDLPERVRYQLEVIWMICATMFGDYGTSPRSGWIEDLEGFNKFCNDIIKTWLESEEGAQEKEEIDAELEHKIEQVCFWCGRGKHRNEHSLFKKWLNGDYEPCDLCKLKMQKGITVVEAGESSIVWNQERYHGYYPTGNWLVMTDSGIRKFCPDEEEVNKAIERRMIFVDHEIYSDMVSAIEKTLNRRKTGE